MSLNETDNVKAIQVLTKSLGGSSQGIEITPNVCGGDARIANTRIPVWVSVDAKANGYSDADLLTSYSTLRAKSLVDAWVDAEAYAVATAIAIARNEAA